jgi:hypothetical protein
VSEIGNAVNLYVPYLERRAHLTNDEKHVDDAQSLYVRYLAQSDSERAGDALIQSNIVSAAMERYTSRLVFGAAVNYSLSHEGKIAYDVAEYRKLIEQDKSLEGQDIEDMVLAYSGERRAIEDATRTYSEVLVKNVAWRQEDETIKNSTDLYSSYLVRRAQMSPVEKEIEDATSIYCNVLVRSEKERARLQAATEAKAEHAASVYDPLLVLGAAQKFAASGEGQIARETETYCDKLLTNVCAGLDFEEILATSKATYTYIEVLLWKISLELNPARQIYLARQAASRDKFEAVPMLGRKNAAPQVQSNDPSSSFTPADRSAILKCLQVAIDYENAANKRADEDVADDWTALVIQAELNSRSQRPSSPVRDRAKEAGFRKLRELVPAANVARCEAMFSKLWSARLGGTFEEEFRAGGFDTKSSEVLEFLSAGPDNDAVVMARSLVMYNLGEALKQTAEIAALPEAGDTPVFYSAGI